MGGLGWTGVIDEFNDAARRKNPSVPEPILITTNGTILAGFGRWRLAVFECRHEIHCIEYLLSEDESLRFILTHHQTRCGWNAFVRIHLALTLEPSLQQRALDNMRAGGKYKGWANLPDVQRIDVRQEIARVAAVGARNVSNVKTILEVAHPRLIEALRNSTLTIKDAVAENKTIHPGTASDYGIRSVSLPGAAYVYVQLAENISDVKRQFSDINLKLNALNSQLPQGAGPISFQSDFG